MKSRVGLQDDTEFRFFIFFLAILKFFLNKGQWLLTPEKREKCDCRQFKVEHLDRKKNISFHSPKLLKASGS